MGMTKHTFNLCFRASASGVGFRRSTARTYAILLAAALCPSRAELAVARDRPATAEAYHLRCCTGKLACDTSALRAL